MKQLKFYCPVLPLAVLLTVLLCVCSAQGQVRETGPVAKNPAFTVTAIADSDRLSALPVHTVSLRSVHSEDEFDPIYMLALTMRTVKGTVISGSSAGESRTETFTVAWDFSQIDVTSEGDYAAVGEIRLPENYTFAPGVLREIHIPVTVKKRTAPVVIADIEKWPAFADAAVLPAGGDIARIANYLAGTRLECYGENGLSYTSTVQWDLSGINTGVPGVYQAVGTVPAPENTVFADDLNVPELTVPVSVQMPGKPEINCFYAGKFELCFPWVTPPGDLKKVTVWMSENGGAWNRITDNVYAYNGFLSLHSSLFSEGNNYRIQVDYDGGQTGILSLVYEDQMTIQSYYEGDRDGGDASGSKPPENYQKPPQTGENGETAQPSLPPSESGDAGQAKETQSIQNAKTSSSAGGRADTNHTAKGNAANRNNSDSTGAADSPGTAHKAAASFGASGTCKTFYEQSTETVSAISGLRLRKMIEDSGEARFSKQGVTVTLSKKAIQKLAVSDSSIFTVQILRTSHKSFAFSVKVDGTPAANLPGTGIILPFETDDPSPVLFLKNEKGKQVDSGNFDPLSKTASFTVNHPGSFVIDGEKAVPAAAGTKTVQTPRPGVPVPAIAAAAVLAAAALIGIALHRRWSL